MDIIVYVCPTPGCGNGAKVTGTRDECPDCKARGLLVKRQPCQISAEVRS